MSIEEIDRIRRLHAKCNCPDCKDVRILLDHISTLEEKMQSCKDENEQLRQNYNNLADEFNQTKSSLEKKVNQERKDKDAWLTMYQKTERELESDLKLNASMLAKQCDLAREAETRVKELDLLVDDELSRRHKVACKLEKAESRLKRLQEAVDRFHQFMRDNWTDAGPVSWREFKEAIEELYRARKEDK